ncbi:MAG: maltose O-acetyltransferase [Thermoleophilaceae bacterium]|jgi:maltose O-acetyltransferase|nr:maltose O-acetyltransferase [Thermoleophilaceae bacterium]
MLGGELYLAADPELVADRARCERLQRAFNSQPDRDARDRILAEWLGSFGADSEIRPPFYCDYGYNITLGANVFLNFNCVVLDVVPVTIGDRVQIASAVQILTADHPLDAAERSSGRENGRPITIEDDAWIGGGAILCPGVTIGARSVIGAGSVVTKDIPADVVAVGRPCRVIRDLSA